MVFESMHGTVCTRRYYSRAGFLLNSLGKVQDK
jgi:hypothetical protein